ncbi:MAG: carbon-nitrogen hydrolase [Candidatus Dormibacteria bacterium]
MSRAQTEPIEPGGGGAELVLGQAADRGAHLVVFPELSLTGYFLKDLVPEVALRLDSAPLLELAEACSGIDAVVGLVLESDDARFYNAAVYLAGGRVQHVHRKVYLPTYGLFEEGRYLAQGDRFRAFEAPLAAAAPRRPWRAGLLVCEDMWHPSAPAVLARDGVELFLCPSASPARGVHRGETLGSEQSYAAITRTYAELYTAYVVYCNRVGYEDGVAFWGGSRVVGPDGWVVGAVAGTDEELVLHRLDLATVRRARVEQPLLRDERHDVSDAESDRLRRRRTQD